MKKRFLPYLVIFTLILFFLSFSNDINGQTHCCCSACTGPPCVVNDSGGCAATCFFLAGCGNPGGAEDATESTCSGTSCNPLPIELVSFQVRLNDEGVELNWETETETNNEGFEIQRMSGINMEWELLDFIKGSGTTFEAQEYFYFDITPPPGINYYRLKQIDFDGTVSLSETEVAQLDEKEKFTMWPTYAKNQVLIRSNRNDHYKHQMEVYDMMGRKVMQKIFDHNISLNISDLPKGHYIVNITSRGNTETLRFVKIE